MAGTVSSPKRRRGGKAAGAHDASMDAEIAELKRRAAILGYVDKDAGQTKAKAKPAPVRPSRKPAGAAKAKPAPVRPSRKPAGAAKAKPAPVRPSRKPAGAAKADADDALGEKTMEEKLEEELSAEEIANFQIERVDMDKLTNKVCTILAARESKGMLQNELWKKLNLSSRNGARLSLKLERMGIVTREKLLQKNRWTYMIILSKMPISTLSIEDAPCLVCPVEQRCVLDGEISSITCEYIDNWVLAGRKKRSQ